MTRALFLACALLGCGSGTSSDREGLVVVPKAQLFYRIAGSGTGTPLLVLHGGPGGRSCELATLEALGTERPVIFYDQRGGGRSSIATDTTTWNLPTFVRDLDSLRRALGLTEIHLYGHSWGGAIAVEYLLTHGAAGVASLTLGGPLVSTPRWLRTTDSLLATLPGGAHAIARAFESDNTTDASGYQIVVDRFSRAFIRRNAPPPIRHERCAVGGETNWQVYQYMWGASEFHATGILRTFDRFDRLPEISTPTLVLVGDHDEVPPAEADLIARQFPKGSVQIIPDAGHFAMQDNPPAYLKAMRAFLKAADAP